MGGLALSRRRCLSRVALRDGFPVEGFPLCLAGSRAECPWSQLFPAVLLSHLTWGTGSCYSKITCLKLSTLLLEGD